MQELEEFLGYMNKGIEELMQKATENCSHEKKIEIYSRLYQAKEEIQDVLDPEIKFRIAFNYALNLGKLTLDELSEMENPSKTRFTWIDETNLLLKIREGSTYGANLLKATEYATYMRMDKERAVELAIQHLEGKETLSARILRTYK